ncbi:ribokinase [Nocardioides luteus]|uniref:Ribokinase n=1 Tax=Nocardioides luteus TaxID=1844 RepID=A0ABQ5SU81_9ACTN|nr:PfkB family carbohydrate kinase [Nocardioides luteus]MDR7309333.1 ribokinase [Nocardioides luteus]GGR70157.1 ribokinase [Nocardioides luteus]GLJ67738.1 ribokinase [Nocardioides luteus]
MPARPSPELVVVGSINVDLTALVERLPAPGETVGGGRLRRDVGGKGANQAVAASRLGARVRMVGAVGADADGGWAVETIRSAGVDVEGVRIVDAATGTALIAVDEAGENQIVVCSGANALVEPGSIAVAPGEAVLMQVELSLGVVRAVAGMAPGFVAVNAAPARELPEDLVGRVDLFIVNESEYAAMPELRAARRVAVTYGASGAAMLTDGVEVARVPAPPVPEVVSTVGAGDAFSAALTLAILAGAEDEQALRTACAVGAAAVAHPSAQPPLDTLAAYA